MPTIRPVAPLRPSDLTAAAAPRAPRRFALLALAGCLLAMLLAGPPEAHAAKLEKGMLGPTEVDGVSQFPIYKDLGVTIFEATISWARVAPTAPVDAGNPADPAYLWPADIDFAIAESKRYGMKVAITLIDAPPWANGGQSGEYAPDRASDFATFARTAAKRYPTVRLWMIWSEPSRSVRFKPFVIQPLDTPITAAQKVAPQRYARLLDAAYGELKAEHRSNIVIGGNTYVTGEVRPLDWMRAMKLPNGRPPRLDYYGHNPFSFRNPNLRNKPLGQGLVDFSDLGRFDKEIQRTMGRPLKKTIKLFLAEFTVPTAPNREFNFHTTLATQARWITSAFRVARSLKNVVALCWVRLLDDPPDGDKLVTTGGLMTHDGKKKPGYHAFKRGAARPGATLSVR